MLLDVCDLELDCRSFRGLDGNHDLTAYGVVGVLFEPDVERIAGVRLVAFHRRVDPIGAVLGQLNDELVVIDGDAVPSDLDLQVGFDGRLVRSLVDGELEGLGSGIVGIGRGDGHGVGAGVDELSVFAVLCDREADRNGGVRLDIDRAAGIGRARLVEPEVHIRDVRLFDGDGDGDIALVERVVALDREHIFARVFDLGHGGAVLGEADREMLARFNFHAADFDGISDLGAVIGVLVKRDLDIFLIDDHRFDGERAFRGISGDLVVAIHHFIRDRELERIGMFARFKPGQLFLTDVFERQTEFVEILFEESGVFGEEHSVFRGGDIRLGAAVRHRTCGDADAADLLGSDRDQAGAFGERDGVVADRAVCQGRDFVHSGIAVIDQLLVDECRHCRRVFADKFARDRRRGRQRIAVNRGAARQIQRDGYGLRRDRKTGCAAVSDVVVVAERAVERHVRDRDRVRIDVYVGGALGRAGICDLHVIGVESRRLRSVLVADDAESRIFDRTAVNNGNVVGNDLRVKLADVDGDGQRILIGSRAVFGREEEDVLRLRRERPGRGICAEVAYDDIRIARGFV